MTTVVVDQISPYNQNNKKKTNFSSMIFKKITINVLFLFFKFFLLQFNHDFKQFLPSKRTHTKARSYGNKREKKERNEPASHKNFLNAIEKFKKKYNFTTI